jgi:exosortase/archaeosortase family protein
MPLQNLKLNTSLPNNKKLVLQFFIRLSVLFTLWFFVYGLFLRPARVIDKPVTNIITISVVKCINFLSPSTAPVSWAADPNKNGRNFLTVNNKEVFGIWDVCNGVDLMFIYISIIALLPYPAKRKIIFSIGGIVAIILGNIIRVCSLYFIYVYQKSAFDFSHHYLFTILMYVLIFYGWLIFIKKKKTI